MKRKILFGFVLTILILCLAGCKGPEATPSATPSQVQSLPQNVTGFWQEVGGNKYVGIYMLEDNEGMAFTHGRWDEGMLIAGKISNVTLTDENVYGLNVFSTENGDMEYSIGIRVEITDESQKIYVKTAEHNKDAEYIFAGATYDEALSFYNGMNSDLGSGDENNGNSGNTDNASVNMPGEIRGFWQGEGANFVSLEFTGGEWIYTEGIWDSDFERSYKIIGIYKENDTVLRLEAESSVGDTADSQQVIYVDIENISGGIIEIKASDSIVFSQYKYSGKTEDEAYSFYEDSVDVSAVFPGVLLGWWSSADGEFVSFTNTDGMFFIQEGAWDSEVYRGDGEIIFIKNTENGVILTVYYQEIEGDDITGPADEMTVEYEVITSLIDSENKITVNVSGADERTYSFAGSSFDVAYSEYIKNLYGIDEEKADGIIDKVKGYWYSDSDSYLCFATEGTNNVVFQEQWGNEASNDVKGIITGGAKIDKSLWLLIAEYYSDGNDEPYMIQFITLDVSEISSQIISISTDNAEMLELYYAGDNYDSAYESVFGQ